MDGLGGLGGSVFGLAVVILFHCRNLLSKIGCPGRHARAGPAVGPQVHKTDLTQGRPPNDVQRPGKLPAVDHHPLVFLDELVLLDAGPKRRLPGETVAGRGHHFLRRHRVARNDAGRHQLAVLDPNRIGVPHAALHVVAEADRPALRGDRKTGQIHDHRPTPAAHAHRRAGVGNHRKPGQTRFAVRGGLAVGRLDHQRPRLAKQAQGFRSLEPGLIFANRPALGGIGELLDHRAV